MKKAAGESPAERGINAIVRLEERNQQARSRTDHFSHAVTNLAGSGASILFHLVWFTVWLVINLYGISGIPRFDPFPFSLLTMIVSLEATFLTLFVLVSQNRMSQEADKRAHLDLQVNILAERETTLILHMLNEISTHLNVEGPTRSELQELLKETRIDDLAKSLEDALPSK